MGNLAFILTCNIFGVICGIAWVITALVFSQSLLWVGAGVGCTVFNGFLFYNNLKGNRFNLP